MLDSISLKTLQTQCLFVHSALSHLPPDEELAQDAVRFVAKGIPSPKLLRSNTINTALIIHTDISADNGVVHTIDPVFLPPHLPLSLRL